MIRGRDIGDIHWSLVTFKDIFTGHLDNISMQNDPYIIAYRNNSVQTNVSKLSTIANPLLAQEGHGHWIFPSSLQIRLPIRRGKGCVQMQST